MMTTITRICRRAARTPLVWIGLGLLTLTLVYKAYCRGINELPTIVIPTPSLPNPNALDFFVRAGKLSYEPDPKTDAARAAMVAANQPALALVRQGFAYPAQMRAFAASNPEYQPYAKFRSLARILAAEERVKVTRGDYAGATNSGLDGITFAVLFEHGGSTIDGLVGDACEAIARRQMWGEIDHLTADEAAAAAHRLEAIDADRVPFVDFVQDDEWSGETELLSLLRKDSVANVASELRKSDDAQSLSDEQGPTADIDQENRQLFTLSKRQVLANYVAKMDAARAAAVLPYNAPQTRCDLASDPISRRMVFEDPRSLYFTYTVNQTNDRLLATALSLRAYRLRNGTYPEALNDLVATKILAHIPADPFAPAAGEAFCYRKLANDRYLLYSVGPDGIDNDGAPIEMKDAKPWREQMPLSTDKGDWVVGANTPTMLTDPTKK